MGYQDQRERRRARVGFGVVAEATEVETNVEHDASEKRNKHTTATVTSDGVETSTEEVGEAKAGDDVTVEHDVDHRMQTLAAEAIKENIETDDEKAARVQSEKEEADKKKALDGENPEDLTYEELREIASDLEIKGRSSMDKQELIDAINKA